jgi:uncharacterized protein YecT (DUF1311 family)
MKNFKARFVLFLVAAAMALSFVPAASAAKLSDAEYTRMIKACPEFAAADKRLNAAWKALSQAAKADKMKEYKAWQQNWNNDTRQALVKSMTSSKRAPKAAVKNGKVNKDLAYAVVTNERAIWIEELAKQEKNAKYLPEFTGSVYLGRNPAGGYLAFVPDGWWTELLLSYAFVDTIPFLADLTQAVENAPDGEVFDVTVKGRLTSELGFEWYEDTPGVSGFSAEIGGE